jgi:hypothetical protein
LSFVTFPAGVSKDLEPLLAKDDVSSELHPECGLLLSKVRKGACAVKEKGMMPSAL